MAYCIVSGLRRLIDQPSSYSPADGRFHSSFFSPGFLRVRFVQDQRETLHPLANAGEERPRSPRRHPGAQQPSHHGIMATVTPSCAIQTAATAAAAPTWILADPGCRQTVEAQSPVRSRRKTSRVSFLLFSTEKNGSQVSPPNLMSHEVFERGKMERSLLFLSSRRAAAPLLGLDLKPNRPPLGCHPSPPSLPVIFLPFAQCD